MRMLAPILVTKKHNHHAGLEYDVISMLKLGMIGLIISLFAAQHAMARGTPDGFADLVEDLIPAVVNIATSKTVEQPSGSQAFPPGSPFEDFFDRFGLPFPPNGDQQAPSTRQMQSLGSGFIIDGDKGLVVTNNHVVADADEITVILQDDTQYVASLLGVDPRTDLALLKIDVKNTLPQVEFGDSSKARIGEWVVAIGNPHGLGGTVTAGIISARGRDIGSGPYDDFIQTDAPINQGNSGGPLFNMDGEVIGINTAIYSRTGGSIGIGFSIPSNQAIKVLDQIQEFGSTKRGWLGVTIQTVSEDIASSLGLAEAKGAIVGGVEPDGPADKAGLQISDIIIELDGKTVDSSRALSRMVADTAIGKQVAVTIIRRGEKMDIAVTLGQLETAQLSAAGESQNNPSPSKPNSAEAFEQALGLVLAPLSGANRERFNLPSSVQGLVIMAVDDQSDAAIKRIQVGYVIEEINQIKMDRRADARRLVNQAIESGRDSVLLRIGTPEGASFVVVNLKLPE
ncbi:MAG: DegQ family serine endoprotease [Alphaproteobacteria bacterium]